MPTVGADIAFGLVEEKLSPAQIRQRVEEALAAVNLLELQRRPIYALSGGKTAGGDRRCDRASV